LKDHVRYFHVKDATADKEMVPAGRGVANWEALLKAASRDEIGDYLSLEPHLKIAASSYGVTGPDLFRVAKECLDEVLSKSA
jgi:sugar phosphate isomerase/epimerase